MKQITAVESVSYMEAIWCGFYLIIEVNSMNPVCIENGILNFLHVLYWIQNRRILRGSRLYFTRSRIRFNHVNVEFLHEMKS